LSKKTSSVDKKRFLNHLTLSFPRIAGVGISTSVPFRNRLLWLRRADPSTTLNKVQNI
jgi:hypothetical protein